MKLIQTLFWILVSLLVSTTSLEAQTNVSEPTDFGTSGDTANNPTDVPINKHLIFLFIAGIGYVFYKQNKIPNPKSQIPNRKS